MFFYVFVYFKRRPVRYVQEKGPLRLFRRGFNFLEIRLVQILGQLRCLALHGASQCRQKVQVFGQNVIIPYLSRAKVFKGASSAQGFVTPQKLVLKVIGRGAGSFKERNKILVGKNIPRHFLVALFQKGAGLAFVQLLHAAKGVSFHGINGEQVAAKAVDGLDHQPVRLLFRQARRHAGGHFLGGPISKGNGEDTALGFGQNRLHPLGQYLGLSCAGAGGEKDGAVVGLHGPLLLFIQ